MGTEQAPFYSRETIASIIANPEDQWKTVFKETIISMIASNTNEMLWYANFLSRCEYLFHFDASFVSSVYFNGKHFVITVNPVLLGVLHKDQIIAILKHSAGHIIHHHFSRRGQEEYADREVIETAKDIVINGSREVPYIQDLPRTGRYTDSPVQSLFYQTLTEKYGIEQYEVGRSFEYYVALILAFQKEADQSCSRDPDHDGDETEEMALHFPEGSDAPENGEGRDAEEEGQHASDLLEERGEACASQGESEGDDTEYEGEMGSETLADRTLEALQNGEISIDSHAFGAQLQEAVGLDESLLDTFMDTTLREMIEEATGFARGYTPGDAKEALRHIEKRKSHKDWKKIFNKKMRNFLTNSLRYREPNKSRQHPIYPDDLDLYGYTPGKKPKVGVVLDVSGSVDETLLKALISEVQAIQRKYAIKTVTLVQVDAEIKSIEKFGVRDKFIVRHGDGGTIMEPGFTELMRQPSREVPDIIICATDGDTEERFEDLKLPNRVQVIWLINSEGRLLFDTDRYPKQQMHVIEFSV
ncbi:MAG TPA: hypothetical protein ENK72_01135 [Epsilonproteobacteria bacterium]|nr:hypothetical protein [Campylobacterota bacterium]